MADRNVDAWRAAAAYLYVLHLDGPALAWEYLRRHPGYQRDWLRRYRLPHTAREWGLRLLEDPSLDARDAHPDWFPDQAGMLQLHPDEDPPPQAGVFEFWHIPGHRHLIHDGKRLLLTTHWPGGHARLLLAPGLSDGAAYLLAARASTETLANYRAITVELEKLALAGTGEPAAVRTRPSAAALLELHALQALDARLSGASQREIAIGLFGSCTVAAGWHADGALRSRIRRLVRHGRLLMRGGYRRLAGLD